MEHQSHQRSDNPDAPGASPVAPSDDLLDVIAQVERQLETLRSAQGERAQMNQRLEVWEVELSKREEEFSSQAKLLAAQQAKLDEQRLQLEQEARAFAQTRQQAEQNLQTLAQQQTQFESDREARDADLERRSREVAEQEATFARRAAALEKHEHQLAERIGQLSQREDQLAAAATELKSAKAQMNEMNQRLASAERQVAEFEAQSQAARDSAKSASERAQSTDAELAQLRGQLQDHGELTTRVQSLEKALKLASEAQAQLKADLDQRTLELRAATEQASTANDLHPQFEQQNARIQELSTSLDSAKSRVQELTRSLEAQSSLAAQASTLADTVAAKEAQIERLREQLASAASASEVSDDSFELRTRTESLEAEIGKLRHQVEVAREAIEQAREEARNWQAKAEEAKIAAAQNCERETDRDDLGQHSPVNNEAVARRMTRLRLMRTLVREQHEKLRRAGEALRERHKEYEQVIAEREQLARVRAGLLQARRQLKEGESKSTGKGAISFICYGVIATCALLGLSWAISAHIAPATYAARAVLAADTASGEVSPDHLAEWQRYHESLVNDPGLLQVAADRMSRHGIASLATPALLAGRLDSDLNVDSPQAGMLIVELKGSGGTRTARELEIFTTALASQANSTRGRRADGLGTAIAETAAAGDPISDTRVVYAGGIFGLGGGLASILGVALWRRMSAAKQTFEEGLRGDADDESWSEVPKVIARPRV